MSHLGRAIFEQVHRQLRPRSPVPEIEVSFRPYADVNNVIRIRENKVLVALSDLLEGAPISVLQAIAVILVSKLYHKPVPKHSQNRYRQFLNRASVRRQISAIRLARGRKYIGNPQGKQFHLEELFENLNQQYFSGLLARPRLSWSRSASRALLGHYDPAHNAIIISKIFDRPQTPRFLVEYILYHEMLHLRHPVSHRGGRRRVHGRQFREAERQFPHWREAKRLLEQL